MTPMIRDTTAFWVIAVTSVLHLAWTGLLASSAAAANSTPVAGVITVTGSRAGAIIALGSTAALALIVSGLHYSRQWQDSVHPWMVVAGLVPQQFFLIVSAASAVSAVIHGHYADGVPRPWQFIAGDQLPVVLIALLYTTAIVAAVRPAQPKARR